MKSKSYTNIRKSVIVHNLHLKDRFQMYVCTISLHDRVVKKGVSFLRGNISIITSSDLSDMHVISMNVILPPRRKEG